MYLINFQCEETCMFFQNASSDRNNKSSALWCDEIENAMGFESEVQVCEIWEVITEKTNPSERYRFMVVWIDHRGEPILTEMEMPF